MYFFHVRNIFCAHYIRHRLREKWDGTRISRITQICTDNKISVDIRQIRAIRVLFQSGIENHTYLLHFTKRYALNQSNSLTDDQWNQR